MAAPEKKYNALFLCTGNSARSILAEAILAQIAPDRFNAFSAGSYPRGAINPHALDLLKKLGHDTSHLRSKSWDEFAVPGAPAFDFVITVCDNAAGEVCPVWPGQPMSAHWGMPDPAAVTGTGTQIALVFAETYRMLANRIRAFSSLKLSRLDRLSLQRHMDEIGKTQATLGMSESFDLPRRLAAESLGTAFLLAAVVGSGIMAERLAGGNAALALLCNTIATGAALIVLIAMFGPISGAHFNPAVSFAFALRRSLAWRMAAAYLPAQVAGAILGVWAAHLMFAEPILQISAKLRGGPAQGFSEFVATFGLIGVIFATSRFQPRFTAMAVGLYVSAGYWFTASTCFANPAVAIARSLSNSFVGIAPVSVPIFIAAELAGAGAASGFFAWLVAAR